MPCLPIYTPERVFNVHEAIVCSANDAILHSGRNGAVANVAAQLPFDDSTDAVPRPFTYQFLSMRHACMHGHAFTMHACMHAYHALDIHMTTWQT